MSTGCGGGLGIVLGPIGFVGGVLLGGAIGIAINACIKDRLVEYHVSLESSNIEPYLHCNDSGSKEENGTPLPQETKPIEDILRESEPLVEKRFCKQFVKKGGYKKAVEDFDKLGPSQTLDMPNGKIGKIGILSDGRRINVRVHSSDERPTLEIQSPGNNGKTIKIRYEK